MRPRGRGLGSPPDVHRQQASAQLHSAVVALEDAREARECGTRALRAYHAAVHAALAEEHARAGGETAPMSTLPVSSIKAQAANVAIEAMRLFGGCVIDGEVPRSLPAATRARFRVIKGGR